MTVAADGHGGFTVGPSAIAGPEPCVKEPVIFRSRDVVIGAPPVRFPELVPDPILDPLIVALYGGPGTGKSTTAALLFGALKQEGVNVELVHEVAKDMTWEGRTFALSHQPYLMAKQLRNYDRLYGQVDVIVTDTSPLLAGVYLDQSRMTTQVAANFLQYIRSDWRSRNTLDVMLYRDPDRPYNQAGRRQSEEEARRLDTTIGTQIALYVPPERQLTAHVDKSGNTHVDRIKEKVYECLPR